MWKGHDVMPVLVRGAAAGDEVHLVEMKPALCRTRHGHVAEVDGVKRTAEQSNFLGLSSRMCGSFVRLGRAQRSSVTGAVLGTGLFSADPPDAGARSESAAAAGRSMRSSASASAQTSSGMPSAVP